MSAQDADREVHAAIARALLDAADIDGWRDVDPYTGGPLAVHAALAGDLDRLLRHPTFLLQAEPSEMLAVLPLTGKGRFGATLRSYRRAAHVLRDADPEARRLALTVAAVRSAELLPPAAAEWPIAARWRSGAFAHQIQTLSGHVAPVQAVACGLLDATPIVVSGDSDGVVRVWDLRRGEPLGPPLDPGQGRIRAVACDTLGSTVYAAAASRTVSVWDITLGRLLCEITPGAEATGLALGCSGEGPIVAVAAGGPVHLWRLDDSEPMGPALTLEGGAQRVACATSGDVDLVIAGGRHTAQVWDVDTGEPLGPPVFHQRERTAWVGLVSAAPIGAFVSGRHVEVWDLRRAMPLGPSHMLDQEDEDAADVAVIEDEGMVAVAGGRSGRVDIWNVADGTVLGPPLGHPTDYVSAVAIGRLAAGQPIAVTGNGDCSVRVWDVGRVNLQERNEHPLKGRASDEHRSWLRAVAIGGPSQAPTVVSSSDFGPARVWDRRSGVALGGLAATGNSSTSLAAGWLDARAVFLGGDREGTITIWDAITGVALGTLRGHRALVTGIACTVIGGDPFAVSTSYDETVRVWHLRGLRLAQRPLVHPHGAHDLAVGVVGGRTIVVSGARDGSMMVWEVMRGRRLAGPLHHPGTGDTCVGLGACDGRAVIVSGRREADSIRVVDLASGELCYQVVAPDGVSSLTCATLAGVPVGIAGDQGGGSGGTIRIWDLRDGALIHRLPVLEPIVDVAVADGDLVLALKSAVTAVTFAGLTPQMWDEPTPTTIFRSPGAWLAQRLATFRSSEVIRRIAGDPRHERPPKAPA